jgi:hypothetical protein
LTNHPTSGQDVFPIAKELRIAEQFSAEQDRKGLQLSSFRREAEQLTRKAIEMAGAGDINALRLCLERLIAPRRERTIHLPLPAVQSTQEISAALSTITTAIGDGQIIPNEGEVLANILAMQATVVQQGELERRVELLEQAVAEGKEAPDEQPESVPEDPTKS